LLQIEIQFSLNNLSLPWLIDAKLDVWVAYFKKQLGIASQVSVIKVGHLQKKKSVSAQ